MNEDVKYRCTCGHEEDMHNFDPDSSFFGCKYVYVMWGRMYDGSPTEPEEVFCRCFEFKPDTLKYVEDLYALSDKKTS